MNRSDHPLALCRNDIQTASDLKRMTALRDFDGILVVALEQAVTGSMASCKLADAGARVIKIEWPEGDFARNYAGLVKRQSCNFVWLHRNKESICLDLKDA